MVQGMRAIQCPVNPQAALLPGVSPCSVGNEWEQFHGRWSNSMPSGKIESFAILCYIVEHGSKSRKRLPI
eukprot:4179142-Amphidinium_carterae.1